MMGRRNKLLMVAAVALISGAAVVGSFAFAQSSRGSHFVVIMRDGSEKRVDTFGWKGISATTIFGASAQSSTKNADAYEKAKVRIICFEECPKELPTGEVREDTVTWRSGDPTVGRFDGVFCDSLDTCSVHQEGRQRDLSEMAFVQFAPR